MKYIGFFWFVILVAGCALRTPTQVIVEVEADPISRRRTTKVTVHVLDHEGGVRLERNVRLRGDGAEAEFPLRLYLVPEGGDATRRYSVFVEAFESLPEGDRKFNQARVISGYVSEQLQYVRMRLEDSCVDMLTCTETQTCRYGGCIDATVPPMPLNLPSGVGWHEIPDTRLESVCPEVPPEVVGDAGCRGMTSAYSSAIADLSHRRMVLWGGGAFGGYQGNELYSFDLRDLRMHRLSEPSIPPTCEEGADDLADGRPYAREIHGGLSYIAHAGQMLVWSGISNLCEGNSLPNMWTLDLTSLEWRRMAVSSGAAGYGSTDYDEATRSVFVHNGRLWRFDLDTRIFTLLNGNVPTSRYETAIIDPVLRRFILMGDGVYEFFDISEGSSYEIQNRAAIDPECQPLIDAQRPGLAFDPIEKKIVGWAGGDFVYLLDPATHDCEVRQYPDGPGAPEGQGTFGRFRYFPSDDVYVLVNRANQNVFVLRLR